MNRYNQKVQLDETASSRLITSSTLLHDNLQEGKIIYGTFFFPALDSSSNQIPNVGVNTGFGGNADTRTQQVEKLQDTLITELQYGTIYPPTYQKTRSAHGPTAYGSKFPEHCLREALPLEDPISSSCMPEAWVRSAIAIRVNPLISGSSGIRSIVVDRILDLLRYNILPRVPLHGSISASGDLSPLSYIGSCVQGKSNSSVLTGKDRSVTTAAIAFKEVDLIPVTLAAKEGLAIVNGTAFSAAVGTLVMHDASGLALLSQVLTAMSVEALYGTAESFHPFFATVRAHPGQVSYTRRAKIKTKSDIRKKRPRTSIISYRDQSW